MGDPTQDPAENRPEVFPTLPPDEAQPDSLSAQALDSNPSGVAMASPPQPTANQPEHVDKADNIGIPAATPASTDSTPSAGGTVKGQPLDGDAAPTQGATTSRSTSSEYRSSQASNSGTADRGGDRVYPIRSVVSVDNSQPTPWAASRASGEHDYFPRFETSWGGRQRGSISTDGGLRRAETASASVPSWSAMGLGHRSKDGLSNSFGGPNVDGQAHSTMFHDGSSNGSDVGADDGSTSLPGSQADNSPGRGTPAELNENLVAMRFKHVVTEDGHAVITGRDGTLQSCEDEPIHAPGAVQAFGLLIALREEPDARFSVRVASENSKRIIGYTPQQLFRLDNFTDILTEEQADNLLDHIDFIRDDDTDPSTSGPEVFSITMRPPGSKPIKLWCAMHIPPSNPDLIACEFELEDDQDYPLRPPDEMTPPIPEDTLSQNPTIEEFNESTEISSKPLRVLRSARKKRGEAGAMQVFDIMSQVQEQLAAATNLEKFLKILVGIVKELTGFHRVMIYQFDSTFNGKVVTELVDPTQTRDLYKGLHFPASDIPKQARELYKLNKVRLLYDRDLESARLVCRTVDDLATPLDLTHGYLRAMSPIHLKYLANMSVRASMSISINAFDELWGLIACHSYGSSGMRVPFPIRKMCRLVGDNASRNIERLSYASRLQARKLINTVPTDKNPSGYIIASSDDLLKLFDADFGMLSIRGETKIMGKPEQSQEGLALLEYLRLRKYTSVLTTQDISVDFPDLRYQPGFSLIAGLLYVPLSVGGQDFIVFFRKGQIKDVKWAGNPYDKIVKEGTANYLEPRTSFQVWHETVVGQCRDWTEEQVETAAVLCLVYGKFIEVWRQKEAALQSSRLTRLLLANSAHEVRTPLNAIINYLEIALEGSLDQDTRDNLAKSHSASKSLIYVINDLLDLTKTEEGQELVKAEILDLSLCLREATDPFHVDATRKGITFEVVEHEGLPHLVHGDHRRVRQAIANLTANAVQHTSKGSVKVECYVTEVTDTRVKIEISVQDSGAGMSDKQLDELFRELEQVSSDTDGVTMDQEDGEKPPENRTLGLGLAVVARTVRNMNGQLRLKSEEGNGSRFVIQLPFELPKAETPEKSDEKEMPVQSSGASGHPSVTQSMPPPEEGEVLLVDQNSSVQNQILVQQKSFDETNSVNSMRSGASRGSGRSNMSDADRLIDAIQTPLPYGEPESESNSLRRRGSRGSPHAKHRQVNSVKTSGGPAGSSATGGISTALQSQSGDLSKPSPPTVGMTYVTDMKTPIKPVKIPDEFSDPPSLPQSPTSSRVLFELPDQPQTGGTMSNATPTTTQSSGALRVLIAEDDPINMRILKKRLEKTGHEVSHAANGEVCANVFGESSYLFDVILMDMQMPIVDGLTSTKMIRAFEKSDKCSSLSSLATRLGRVPIFAVSASLVEKEKSTYVDAGFDGWILKPIDFKRLYTLLAGIFDDDTRNDCVYVAGEWERGGWFNDRKLTSPVPPSSTDVPSDVTLSKNPV